MVVGVPSVTVGEASGRGPGRRVGRDAVLAAAGELFDGAQLADLLSFLGTRAVAEAADVRPATVHHHFATVGDRTRPNARLASAVLEAALTSTAGRVGPLGDAPSLPGLAAVAARCLEDLLADRRRTMAVLAGASVAGNDADVRAVMQVHYATMVAEHTALFEALALHAGRCFDAAAGHTAETVAVATIALADGLLVQHQVDLQHVCPEHFGALVVRLFESVTTLSDVEGPATESITDRLLGRAELPAESGMDQSKRTRIVEAVRRLHAEAGVAGISVTAVARAADVSRGTVIANFGDRNGLAAAVYAQHVPQLERRLAADQARSMPLAQLMERHLHRLVDHCKSDPDLTAMLLDGIIGYTIRHGAPTYTEPADPRGAVPLPALLVPALLTAGDVLQPGVADTPAAAKDLAATITNLAMVRALSRTNETATETVHRVMDLVLDGILARP